jgi:hypothetical protein
MATSTLLECCEIRVAQPPAGTRRPRLRVGAGSRNTLFNVLRARQAGTKFAIVWRMRLALVTAMIMLTAVLIALPVSHFSPQSGLTPRPPAPARLADSSAGSVQQPPPVITVTDELVRATVVKSVAPPPPPPKAVRAPVQRPVTRKPPAAPPQRRSLLARIFLGTGEPRPQPLLRIKLR